MHPYVNDEKMRAYLTSHHLEAVIDKSVQRHHEFHKFSKGELICILGESIGYFNILLEGQVKVFTYSSEGKILSLQIFDAPTNLGDIELITGTKYRCSVEALSDCICLAFPIEVIRTQAMDHNGFLRYLCSDLCHKFDDIASRSSSNLLHPLRNRLVSYMLEHLCEDTQTVTIPILHKELAELFGTTYRHLVRSLAELESQGLIKIAGGTIRILNEDRLRSLSVEIYPHKI